MATSLMPQAAGREEKISNPELQTTRSNQRAKQLGACGLRLVALTQAPKNKPAKKLVAGALWLAAFVALLFLQNSAHAQASFPPININLDFPQYQRLKLDGGYHYIQDAGLSGIILYRENEERYIAYERRCSMNDDVPVVVDGSGLFMKGCQSTFNFSGGYPTGGPVRNPLLKYRVSLNGQNLTITDEEVF